MVATIAHNRKENFMFLRQHQGLGDNLNFYACSQ